VRPVAREVPRHDIAAWQPRRSRYLVCVFVINEGERLHRQLDRMQAVAHGLDVIVADGGSTDGSTGRSALEPRGVRALLTRLEPGGLSAQMRMAFAFALDQGYDGVIAIDGNDKDDPAAIADFSAALDRGVDHVQGSRYITGGHHEHTPLLRHLGVRLLHAPLISRAAGVRYTDTTNGFRGYSARFLGDPRVAPFRSVFLRYELHYYLAIRAGELGFQVEELPVTRRYPARGKVPTKIGGFHGAMLVLRTLWRAVRHRYDPMPESA
jgi:dolichol-phosphate mannosyltransferase